MFESCHPGPTGRGGRRYPHLSVGGPDDPDDGLYRLCHQCGYPCLMSRDSAGDSEDSPGLQVTNTVVTIPGGTKTVKEMKVVAGCPFCGSMNYEGKHQMRSIPVRTNLQTRR
jgi:predicted nucleic-acid-binding Zn-ribbon protein